MQVITNLWHEQLHDLFITTVNGRKLRLRIEQDGYSYYLEGEFYEVDDKSWYLVEFSKSRDTDPAALLTACLENLHRAMLKKSDAIQDIHNTSSTPLVSVEKQKEILARLGIAAQIRVKQA
jgi:hypothetical protein